MGAGPAPGKVAFRRVHMRAAYMKERGSIAEFLRGKGQKTAVQTAGKGNGEPLFPPGEVMSRRTGVELLEQSVCVLGTEGGCGGGGSRGSFGVCGRQGGC